MFALYTTVEHTPGTEKTFLHGTYESHEDAAQIGENLRLLYPWVKHIAIERREELPKKMAPSLRKVRPQRRRKSS